MLDPGQQAALAQDGFINVGPVLARGDLDQIASEYDQLVKPGTQVLGNERDGVFPYRAMLNFRSPTLAAFVLHPALVSIAQQLLGDEVRFWWDQGINKPPGAGSFIPWHQDNGYEHGSLPEYFTFWLALDDSTLENGGLEVIPGSHRKGSQAHEWAGAHATIASSSLDVSAATPLDAQAGDLLVFSSLLVHQTVGNDTPDRERRAWVIQYCRGDARNDVTGEVYDNRPWVVRAGTAQTHLRAERRFDLRADRP